MKSLNLFAMIFAFAFLSISTNFAQESSKNLDLLTEVASIEDVNSTKPDNIKTSAKYVPFSLDPAVYGIKASKDFGSFIIPSTNYLKIVASDNNVYTKAQMVNKETGKNIFSVELEGLRNTVDMTNTPAGLYMLVLSNDKGDIYKENIMIM